MKEGDSEMREKMGDLPQGTRMDVVVPPRKQKRQEVDRNEEESERKTDPLLLPQDQRTSDSDRHSRDDGKDEEEEDLKKRMKRVSTSQKNEGKEKEEGERAIGRTWRVKEKTDEKKGKEEGEKKETKDRGPPHEQLEIPPDTIQERDANRYFVEEMMAPHPRSCSSSPLHLFSSSSPSASSPSFSSSPPPPPRLGVSWKGSIDGMSDLLRSLTSQLSCQFLLLIEIELSLFLSQILTYHLSLFLSPNAHKMKRLSSQDSHITYTLSFPPLPSFYRRLIHLTCERFNFHTQSSGWGGERSLSVSAVLPFLFSVGPAGPKKIKRRKGVQEKGCEEHFKISRSNRESIRRKEGEREKGRRRDVWTEEPREVKEDNDEEEEEEEDRCLFLRVPSDVEVPVMPSLSLEDFLPQLSYCMTVAPAGSKRKEEKQTKKEETEEKGGEAWRGEQEEEERKRITNDTPGEKEVTGESQGSPKRRQEKTATLEKTSNPQCNEYFSPSFSSSSSSLCSPLEGPSSFSVLGQVIEQVEEGRFKMKELFLLYRCVRLQMEKAFNLFERRVLRQERGEDEGEREMMSQFKGQREGTKGDTRREGLERGDRRSDGEQKEMTGSRGDEEEGEKDDTRRRRFPRVEEKDKRDSRLKEGERRREGCAFVGDHKFLSPQKNLACKGDEEEREFRSMGERITSCSSSLLLFTSPLSSLSKTTLGEMEEGEREKGHPSKEEREGENHQEEREGAHSPCKETGEDQKKNEENKKERLEEETKELSGPPVEAKRRKGRGIFSWRKNEEDICRNGTFTSKNKEKKGEENERKDKTKEEEEKKKKKNESEGESQSFLRSSSKAILRGGEEEEEVSREKEREQGEKEGVGEEDDEASVEEYFPDHISSRPLFSYGAFSFSNCSFFSSFFDLKKRRGRGREGIEEERGQGKFQSLSSSSSACSFISPNRHTLSAPCRQVSLVLPPPSLSPLVKSSRGEGGGQQGEREEEEKTVFFSFFASCTSSPFARLSFHPSWILSSSVSPEEEDEEGDYAEKEFSEFDPQCSVLSFTAEVYKPFTVCLYTREIFPSTHDQSTSPSTCSDRKDRKTPKREEYEDKGESLFSSSRSDRCQHGDSRTSRRTTSSSFLKCHRGPIPSLCLVLLLDFHPDRITQKGWIVHVSRVYIHLKQLSSSRRHPLLLRRGDSRRSSHREDARTGREERRKSKNLSRNLHGLSEEKRHGQNQEEERSRHVSNPCLSICVKDAWEIRQEWEKRCRAAHLLLSKFSPGENMYLKGSMKTENDQEEEQEEENECRRRRRNRGPIKQERCEGGADDILQERASVQGGGSQSLHNESFPSKLLQTSSASSSLPSHVGTFFVPYREEEEERSEEEKGSQEREKKEKNDFSRSPLSGTPVSIWIAQFPRFLLPPETSPAAPLSSSSPTTGLTSPRLSPSLQENRQAPSSSSPSCSLAFSSAPSSRHPCASSSSSPCASSSSLPPSSSSPPPSSCSSAALSSSFPLLRPSRCCTVLIGRGSYPLSIHGEISFLNIRNHEEESLPSSCDFKETSFIQEDLPSDDRRRREEKGDDDEEKEDISLAAHLKTSSSLHKNVQERERKERTEVFQGKEEKQEKKSYVMSLQRKEKKDRKEGGEDKGAGEKRERGVGGPRNAFHRARQISSREDADNTIAKFLQNEEVLEEREEETRSLIRKDELEKMVSMDAEEEDREGERDPQNTPFSSKHGKDNKGDGGDDVREEPRSVSRGGDREEDIDLGQKRKADKERRERKRRDEKEEEEETSQVRDCDLQDNDASEEEEPPSREKEGEESRDRIEEILRKTKGTSFSLHSRYSPLSQSYCHPFHRCPCGVCTGQKLFYFSFFAFGVPPPFSSPSPLVFSLPPSLGLKGEKLEGGEKEKEKKERALKNGEENVGCGKTIEEEDDETERKKKKMEAKLSPEDRGREPFSLEKIDERKISYIKTSPHHVNISSPFSTYISPEVRSSSSSLSLRPSESSRVSPRILIGGKNALLRAVAEAALSSTTVRRGRGDDERQKSLLAVYDKKKRREEEISLSQTASMIKKTPSSSVMVSPTRRDLERQGLDGEERRKSISDGREVMKEDRMEKSGVQEREERRKKESLETKTGEREEEEEKDREEPPLSNSLLTGGNRVLDSKNTRKNTIEKEEERRKERETSIGFRGREEEEEERRGGYQASSQYTSSSGVCTLCTSAMSVLGESCPYHHVIRQIKVLHDVAHISNLSSLSLTLEDEREKKEEEGGESERGMFFSDDLQASLLREWTFSPVIAGRDHIVEIRFSVRGSSCKTGRHLDTRQEADERLICCSPNEKKKKEKGELCLSTDSMKKGGRDTMKKKNLDDSDEDVGGRRDEKEAEGRKRRKTSEEATPEEEEEEEGENKKEEEEEGGREWTKEEMDKKRRGREEQDTLENEKGIEEREMQGNLEEEKEKKKKDKIMRIEKEKEEEEMCWKERSLYSQFLPCCLGYFSSPSAPLITTTTDNEWTSRSSSSFPSPFLSSSRHRCNPSPSPSSFSSSSCCPIHRKSDRRRHDEREEKEAGERRFFHISCLLNFLLHFTIEAGLPFPSPVKTHTEHQLKEEEKEEEREEGELVPSRKGTVWSLSCEEGWSERRIVVEEDGRKKKKKEGTSVMLHEGGHQSRLVLPLILRFRGGRRERRDNDKTNNSHKETLPHFSTKSTLIRDVQKVKEGLEDFTQGACDNGDDKKKKKKKVEEEMSRRTTPQDEEEEAKEKEKIEKWGEEEEEIVYYAVCISSHAARVVKSLILQWKRFHGDSSFSSSYLCNDCAQLNHYEKRDKTNGVRSSFSNRLLSPFSFPLPLCLFFSCLSSYRRVSSSLASKKKSSSLHFPCIFGCVNTLQVSSLSGVGCLPPSDDEVLSFLSSSRRKEQEEEKETRQEEGDKEEEDDVDDLKARGSSSPTLFLSHRHGQGTCSSSSLSFFSPYMSDNRRSGSSCIPGASLSSISDAFLLPFRSPFPSFSLASSPLHWRRPLWSSSMSVGGLIGAGDRDVWLQRLEKFSRSTIRELGLKEVLSILREDKKKLLLREPLLTTKLQRTKKKKMEKGRSSSPVEEKRVEEEEAKIKRSEKNEREEQEGKNLVFEKEEEEGHEVREGNNNTGEGDEMKDSKNPEPDWDQRKEEEVDVSSSNEEEEDEEEEEEKGRTILRLEVGSAVRMIAYNLPRSRERDTLISRYRKRQENLACSKDISK